MCVGVCWFTSTATAPREMIAKMLVIALSLASNIKPHLEPLITPSLRRLIAAFITLLWNCPKVTECTLNLRSWASCGTVSDDGMRGVGREIPEKYHHCSPLHWDQWAQEEWKPSRWAHRRPSFHPAPYNLGIEDFTQAPHLKIRNLENTLFLWTTC